MLFIPKKMFLLKTFDSLWKTSGATAMILSAEAESVIKECALTGPD